MRDFSMKAPDLSQNDEANLPTPYSGAPFTADGGKMPSSRITVDDINKLNAKVDRRKREKEKRNAGVRGRHR